MRLNKRTLSTTCDWTDLVAQGGAVALQTGHAVRQVEIVLLVQRHLVGGRLLPVPLRPHLHPVVEADDGAGLDVRPGKQSLPGVLDPALLHLHKDGLVGVPGLGVRAEHGPAGGVLGEGGAGGAGADQRDGDGGVDQGQEVLHLTLPGRHQLAVAEGPEETRPAVRVEIELETGIST